MSYYLIGIGGTGARCMEAFVHLNGAGLLKDGQPIKLVYVDADVSCGNLLKTQHATKTYEKARKIGFGGCQVFKNEILESKVWSPVDEDKDDMDKIFERVKMINREETKALGFLYESLFTEIERGTNLDMGFRGHPAIGAAVLNKNMNPDEDPWKDLLPQINSDKDAKIFLFASVFGGTGASGFPTIARLLQKFLKKDADNKCVATIGGALVLPYFSFPTADEENEKEMQAKVDEFMLNTKSALDYYDKNGLLDDIFTSIYMVGDSDMSEMKQFSLGSNTQKNEANIVEVYAALAAFDFFNRSDYADFKTPMIARGDDEKISWGDLPNVCLQGTFQEKMATYIKFLYTYRNGVYPSLEECATNESKRKNVAWYIKLVQKAGKIDVYNDQHIMEQFRALAEYADLFFAWLSDVINNDRRQIELVNKMIYVSNGSNQIDKNYKLDAYQLVLPIVERKDKLDQREFWQALCNYTEKMDKTTASGAEILMQAVESICRK